GDADMRLVDRFADDRAGCASGERLVEEPVSVGGLAFEGDERCAPRDITGIEGDAARIELRGERAGRRLGNLVAGPKRGHVAHSRATVTSSNGSTRSPTS